MMLLFEYLAEIFKAPLLKLFRCELRFGGLFEYLLDVNLDVVKSFVFSEIDERNLRQLACCLPR